jgi:Ca-activated chloride channel family protein
MSMLSSRNRIRSLFIFLALVAFAFPRIAAAAAKPADDYLHGGAAKYIQGRLQEAGVEVEEGLRQYPNDSRLKTLANQLKNMKDQQKKDQGGQSSQGGDQNKDKQDKKDSSGQGGQDGKKDPKDQKDQKDKDKDKEKEKQKEQEAKDKDKDKGGQDQKPQPEEGKEGDSSGQAPAPAKPGQMSKEEAERLLNSYQDDEKREQKQLQKRNRQPVEVEEDW